MFGYFLTITESGQAAEEQILDAIGDQLSPNLQVAGGHRAARTERTGVVRRARRHVTFVVVVIALFSEIDLAFNRIWKIPDDESRGLWADRSSTWFTCG